MWDVDDGPSSPAGGVSGSRRDRAGITAAAAAADDGGNDHKDVHAGMAAVNKANSSSSNNADADSGPDGVMSGSRGAKSEDEEYAAPIAGLCDGLHMDLTKAYNCYSPLLLHSRIVTRPGTHSALFKAIR